MGEKKRNVRRFFDAGNTKCPICWKSLANRNDIAVEHVPPKSLGGIKACLTCVSCNNSFAKDEEFMRRDVEGTTRMSLYENNRRVAASDVVLSKPSEAFVVETKENLWLSEGDDMPTSSLAKATSAIFQTPSQEQVLKAWIKSFYLMAGCAHRGEAWNTAWAPRVRSYLQGDIPWDDDLGLFQKNNAESPTAHYAPLGVVGRIDAAQRSDIFFSAWKEYAFFFGLPKKDIPDDGWLPMRFRWLEEGPFVYGEPAKA